MKRPPISSNEISNERPWKRNQPSSGDDDDENNSILGMLGAVDITTGLALKTLTMTTVVLYIMNQSHMLPRPISGVVANLAVYSGYTNPGDVMLAPSIPAGGHISHGKKEHSGTAGLVHGLEIEFYPFDAEEMTIDVDKTKQVGINSHLYLFGFTDKDNPPAIISQGYRIGARENDKLFVNLTSGLGVTAYSAPILITDNVVSTSSTISKMISTPC